MNIANNNCAPKVKICCISSIEEAEIAISHGADVIGLVGNMPSGPGVIDDALIKEIANSIPSSIATSLLTSETNAQDIISHYQRAPTSSIQIVDRIATQEYTLIRKALPKVNIVQVIHMMDHHSVQEAIEISQYVDAILLDSGNPNLPTKELGGTGKTHNWDLSQQISTSISIPLFLAGGLNKDNVRQAINKVQPYGVDVCSGVRTDGHLDPIKLFEFIKAVND